MATKEELLLRALNTTNMGGAGNVQWHEDLSDLLTYITPKDVPLFSRLARVKATALLHEWTETTLVAPSASAAYADGGIPADTTESYARRNNTIMSVGAVAKATNLLRSLNLVGTADALARELEEKMIDVMRAIEWFLFNGDRTQTSPQQCDGLAKLITAANSQAVDNRTAGLATGGTGANVVLTESNLKAVLTKIYDAGGYPDLILARPYVAYQIANFTADKIRFAPGAGLGGVGAGALTYLSPFGSEIEVVPSRTAFLPSGSVFVLQKDQARIAFSSNEIEVMDLATTNDGQQKLIKSYFTLEMRALPHHGVITNVSDQ